MRGSRHDRNQEERNDARRGSQRLYYKCTVCTVASPLQATAAESLELGKVLRRGCLWGSLTVHPWYHTEHTLSCISYGAILDPSRNGIPPANRI